MTWNSDHLERMAEPFREERVDWAYSRPVWVAREGLVTAFVLDLRKPDHLHRFMTEWNSIPASCVTRRRTRG